MIRQFDPHTARGGRWSMPLLLPLNFIKRASRETGSNSLTTDPIEFSSFDAITELFQFLKLPVFSTNLPDYKNANIVQLHCRGAIRMKLDQ